MTDKTNFDLKIREIKDACVEWECIFRGENRHYREISSKLYRQCCEWEELDNRNPLVVLRMIPEYQIPEEEHSSGNHFPVLELEKTTFDRARSHIRLDAPDIEVLTELQHHGGKTASIDFTRNIHVALFFACNGEFDKDGRVILFDKSGMPEQTKVVYDSEENYRIFNPAGKDPRVVFQSSVFVCARRGCLDLEKDKGRCKSITIEKRFKKEFLDCLRQYYGIETRTIYNDIHGFIENQEEYTKAAGKFYFGLKRQQKEQFVTKVGVFVNAEADYLREARGTAERL